MNRPSWHSDSAEATVIFSMSGGVNSSTSSKFKTWGVANAGLIPEAIQACWSLKWGTAALGMVRITATLEATDS
jgi:hypothetical protein